MYKLFFDRDNLTVYPWYFADQVITKDIKTILGRKVNRDFLKVVKKKGYMYGDVAEFDALGKLLLDRVTQDHAFYKKVKQKIMSSSKELLLFCDTIPYHKLSQLSSKQLYALYKTYAEKIRKVRLWGWIPPLIDGVETYFLSDYVQGEFMRFMAARKQSRTAASLFSILSSSEKMSEVQQEEVERLRLLYGIQKNNKRAFRLLAQNTTPSLQKIEEIDAQVFRKIARHANRYKWLTYAYIGPELDPQGVVSLLHEDATRGKSAQQQFRDIVQHFKELPRKKKQLIKKLHLPKDLQYFFEIYAFFMYIKDYRKGIYQKSYVAMDPVVTELGSRFGLTLNQMRFVVDEDLKKMIFKQKNLKREILQRTQSCVVKTENGKTVFLTPQERKKFAQQITRSKSTKKVIELHGTIAFAGKVSGVAKIVKVVSDIPKLRKGEILISPATNPDLVPAMKIASAFVTDTGGITCHAAIVSREMKKPCIVGTKIATKIFHDGDLVEVDANTGLVRKI